MAKSIRSVSQLLDKLIGVSNADQLEWKRTQPSLFEANYLGRKIEVEWDNGDSPAFYVNNNRIKGDIDRIQELYKSASEYLDRKNGGKKNIVRNLLRDIRKEEAKIK